MEAIAKLQTASLCIKHIRVTGVVGKITTYIIVRKTFVIYVEKRVTSHQIVLSRNLTNSNKHTRLRIIKRDVKSLMITIVDILVCRDHVTIIANMIVEENIDTMQRFQVTNFAKMMVIEEQRHGANTLGTDVKMFFAATLSN